MQKHTVNSRFKRMSVEWNVLLFKWQLIAGCNRKLPTHQVLSGDGLGDRVFDLQPRVHLHEEKVLLVVHDELDRASAFIQRNLES